MRTFLALSCAFLIAGCGGHGQRLAGPVAPPEKPAYMPISAPMRAEPRSVETAHQLEEDFIHAAGTNAVFFDTASANLKADARDTLDRQAAWLINHPEIALKIEGHADERASAPFNKTLGLKRAKSVVDYLVAKGVSNKRFKVISYGEATPVEAKKGDVPINRRVVTVLVP